ncbi:hypothetical protein BH10PLA1_BH10PLA1_13560 [soil metagenome]
MKSGYWVCLFLTTLCLPIAGCSLHQRVIARADYDRAVRFQKVGQTDEAIESLQMATKANPKLTPAHSMLGDIYRDRGDFEQASREYETCSKLEPRSAVHLYDLGLMNQLLGRLQQAADDYLKALKLKPTNADANMNLGIVYLSLGDHQKSIEHLRAATKQAPTSLEAWTNLGVALDESGDLPAAEQAYRKAMELSGDNNGLLINYAGNLIQQNRPDEAVILLRQAIDGHDSPLAEKRMGDALSAKEWLDAAVGRYERAVRLDPHYAIAYNALGDALITMYDRGLQLNEPLRARAVAAWRASIAIQPNQPVVNQRLKKWSHLE